MQHCEADPESTVITPATVAVDDRRSNEEESSTSIARIQDTDLEQNREPEQPINLVVSTQESSNQCKSPPKNVESSPNPKKYFLRDPILKPIENKEKTDFETDEDRENLISQLSIFKELPDGKYSCDICSLKNTESVYEQKSLIIHHLLHAHAYSSKFECPSCEETFKKETQLTSHYKVTHLDSKNTKTFECSRCQHQCDTEDLLKLHVLRKHGKCFKTSSAKTEHEKSAEKCKCSACSEQTKKSHSGSSLWNVKQYVCKQCSEHFKSQKSLFQHLADHKCPPPGPGFQCKHCAKWLSSKDHLKKHTRIHTGERPFPCPECGRTFALRTTMRIHALTHGGIKAYECAICRLSYSQRSALMMHWKSKHKNVPPPPPVQIHQYFDREGRVVKPARRV